MAKKLKEYKYSGLIVGMNVEILLCAYTRKEAAELLIMSEYSAKQYVSQIDPPRTKECIENPHVKYVYFNSGELCYAKPEWRNKLMKFEELADFIKEYRKTVKSYAQTMEIHNSKNK